MDRLALGQGGEVDLVGQMVHQAAMRTAAETGRSPFEVVLEAVRRNCAAIICAHNHPSGAADPSPEDVAVTRQIVEAGKLLDVECLDHLVIGRQRFVSLRERGLGFS